ncbi:hypothetical protein ECE50_010435 [Chitinophaga sp. Mgbs1]|uniref:Uncharacterized protein n=1 Tax=Chitinophaga solisilvae TaxID=1233460 RepID=A0A9Q5GVT0_9BACT|nr:hypothetical protein [Chitinophaga solisilvae]
MKVRTIASCIVFLTVSVTAGQAQTAPQLFNRETLEYPGDKEQQAKLLLRKPVLWGKIKEKSAVIDTAFIIFLKTDPGISKDRLKQYLDEKHIREAEVGGSIAKPLSGVTKNGKHTLARYFVIHDMSTPSIPHRFPDNINDATWGYNRLSHWKWNAGKQPPSHTMITRLGTSKTMIDFSEKKKATKFERDILGPSYYGLFLHVEMLQPRIYPPGTAKSAPVAPDPGFTDAQYERLALMYICAGIRKGEWLVPAFHVDVDELLNDGHDDPQHFELKKFTDYVLKITGDLKSE